MSSEVTIECWNCKDKVTLEQRSDEDGFCPHCMCELDLEDYLANALADRDAALAQLAAIQQAKGEEVEVVGWLRKWAADKETPKKQKNENGRLAWPFKYKLIPISQSQCLKDDVSLMTVAQHQRITAAMAAEVVELKESMAYRTSLVGRLEKERDALRAELAAVKAQEAVAIGHVALGSHTGVVFYSHLPQLPDGAKLYAIPPASPDVEGLVKALENARLFIRNGIDLGYISMPETDTPDPAHDTLPMIDTALSTWRQAQV